jgi:D-serine deaminase-like pyridoxal phosphate-dependent protein
VTLDGLDTPCLVLDRAVLARNIASMAAVAARHGVLLRPHMKTAKSIDVARAADVRAITVSTLAEAAYFARHGITDMIYAAGITPRKLDRVAALNAGGAAIKVITDDPAMAAMVAAHPGAVPALVEVDSGEHRGGMAPDEDRLMQVAAALGPCLAGVLTHAGHSYAGRTEAEMAEMAEAERLAITGAAARLRAAGHTVEIVSMGSSPTVRHAKNLDGVTEVRAGVYMFGDLFQAGIHTHAVEDIAMSVLASVIGVRAAEHRFIVDAGGLALSKDRSTAAGPVDYGFGLVLDRDGTPRFGHATILSAYQEHGVVACDPTLPMPQVHVGDLVRILPNHTCMTAAAHERYHVVEGGTDVVAVWNRLNFW